MPMPSSAKLKTRRMRPCLACSAVAANVTFPWCVNFTALSARFSRAPRKRKTSPAAIAGRLSAILMLVLRSLLWARAARAAPTASASARGAKGSLRRTRPWAFAFAASTITVVRTERRYAALLIALAHSRSRVPRSDDTSNSASATIPVNGVRISCAMPASAASIRRGDAFSAGDLGVRRGRRRRGVFFRTFGISPLPGDATLTWKTDSIEPGQAANIGGRYSARTKLAQAGGLRRFRQLVAGLIENKPVMMIARRAQTEQHLEQAVHRGCVKQVATSHHVGHALRGVVGDNRKVIASGGFFARQNHIAPCGRIGRNRTGFAARSGTGLDPGQSAGAEHRCAPVEPQRIWLARLQTAVFCRP